MGDAGISSLTQNIGFLKGIYKGLYKGIKEYIP